MASYTVTGKNGQKTNVDFKYLPKLTDELDKLHTSKKELSETDIYKITLWKVDRYPFIDDEKIKGINSLATITTFDKDAKTKTIDVLNTLLSTDGIGLPMASTYLRFINPKVYQIIDVRAYRAAFNYKPKRSYAYVNRAIQIDIYIKYIERLHAIADKGYHGVTVSFKDLDRFLYDFDKFVGNKINDNPQLSKKDIEKKLKEFIAEQIEKQKEQNKGGE